jgi:hypothetical protein
LREDEKRMPALANNRMLEVNPRAMSSSIFLYHKIFIHVKMNQLEEVDL